MILLRFACPAEDGMVLPASSTELDERTCRLICPIAAAMVGVCLTGTGYWVRVSGRGVHSPRPVATTRCCSYAMLSSISHCGSIVAADAPVSSLRMPASSPPCVERSRAA